MRLFPKASLCPADAILLLVDELRCGIFGNFDICKVFGGLLRQTVQGEAHHGRQRDAVPCRLGEKARPQPVRRGKALGQAGIADEPAPDSRL